MSSFKAALFFIVAFAVLSQNAVAGPETVNPTASKIEKKLGELYQRHTDYCGVYKVVIDNNTYIMTTCGGIILVPEG
jgi:hypothetical protein